MHSHFKLCRKYKTEKCCYSFRKYLTDHTIVSAPLGSNLPSNVKSNIANEREGVLSKFKEYIDNSLIPRKKVLNSLKENFDKVKSVHARGYSGPHFPTFGPE